MSGEERASLARVRRAERRTLALRRKVSAAIAAYADAVKELALAESAHERHYGTGDSDTR